MRQVDAPTRQPFKDISEFLAYLIGRKERVFRRMAAAPSWEEHRIEVGRLKELEDIESELTLEEREGRDYSEYVASQRQV